MNFTKTGTLSGWSMGETEIIPEIKTLEDGKSRGGAFLCIPNFDLPGYPFEVKHGEYRITECNPTLPHEKFISAESGAGWGKLSTRVIWEEKNICNLDQLEVRAHIQALSPTATIRPGFHPYFKVYGTFTLEVGAIKITSENMPVDKMISIPVQKNASGSAVATLLTGNLHISIAASFEDDTLRSNACFSFCLWSDKPEEYICVESVYGEAHGLDNLPTAILLNRGQSTTIVSKIIVNTI